MHCIALVPQKNINPKAFSQCNEKVKHINIKISQQLQNFRDYEIVKYKTNVHKSFPRNYYL